MTGPPGPCGCGCALTEDTSYGFDVEWFAAEVLGTPLDPWERWAVIHGGELLPDGRPRFRKLLIIVARQQGKTFLFQVLCLFWLFVEKWPMILGTSTNLGYAKEVWQEVVLLAEQTEALAVRLRPDAVRKAAGEECLTVVHVDKRTRREARSRYRIAASNRKGGRSLRIDRLGLDELREHQDWSAWAAAYNAMNARPYGQVFAISNQGDDTSVVLNSLRNDALAYIETGEGDPRLGLIEYSAPNGSDPTDPVALAMANPNVGRRTDLADLVADGARAKRNGGEELVIFLTEVMCIRVKNLNPAIDLDAWKDCLGEGGLDAVRSRAAMVWDVSPDLLSVVLYAAAVLDDGRVQIDAVKAWDGPGCTRQAVRELPALIKRTKPAALGWLPDGPGVALAADMKPRPGMWPPPGVPLEEIKAEVPAVCMGYDELVRTQQLVRSGRREDGEVISGDPLLDSQVEAAEWKTVGNRRVFSRSGGGHVNALYAAAGAAHLARTLPPDLGAFIIR